jgi:hypothetical protein
MSLKLAKNNTPIYDYFSDGDGSDPISVSGTVNGSGGTVDSTTVALYLIATQYNYTDIVLSSLNEQVGMDWKLSLDGSTWLDTVEPSDMDALSEDQVTLVYAKSVLTNDGGGNQPETGIYTVPDIQIAATENPE